MNRVKEGHEDKAKPSVWPVYVAAGVVLIVGLAELVMFPTWYRLISIAKETGEPPPDVFFLGVAGFIVVGFATIAFLIWVLVTRWRLFFPPKLEGEE